MHVVVQKKPKGDYGGILVAYFFRSVNIEITEENVCNHRTSCGRELWVAFSFGRIASILFPLFFGLELAVFSRAYLNFGVCVEFGCLRKEKGQVWIKKVNNEMKWAKYVWMSCIDNPE